MPLSGLYLMSFVVLGALTSAAVFAETPRCSIEALSGLPEVTITSATRETIQEIDGDRLEALGPVPHCRVRGVISNSIGFELHLPDDWNGKFLMGGGGGFVGTVMNYALLLGALNRGYATVGTDTGHRANAVDASWALNDMDALVNFGHQAVHRTAVNAKTLIEVYYGKPSDRNLFMGCSRGGGQALIEAQRYPEDFDAIYAGAPAFNWTHEMGASWTQMMMKMYPDPSQIAEPVIDSGALQLLADAVMAKCDALDGLEDRILNDPRQCDFDVRTLACENDASTSCLTEAQIAAAEAIYSDFEIDGQVIHGTPVGSEWPEFPRGWEQWKTGGYSPGKEAEGFHEGTASVYPMPPIPNAKWGFAL
jgi:feruloyl esterase